MTSVPGRRLYLNLRLKYHFLVNRANFVLTIFIKTQYKRLMIIKDVIFALTFLDLYIRWPLNDRNLGVCYI